MGKDMFNDFALEKKWKYGWKGIISGQEWLQTELQTL